MSGEITREELEQAIREHLWNRVGFQGEVDLQRLAPAKEHFPSMATPYRGDLFLAYPGLAFEPRKQLEEAVEVLRQGFDNEEILTGRLRRVRLEAQKPEFLQDDNATMLTMLVWMHVEVR